MIIGHGIDVVEINGFGRLFTPLTLPYLDRYFTEHELIYAGNGINQIPRLAARFAAKEAVLKALGRGWGSGVSYTDVEVQIIQSGAPSIRLYRNLQAQSEVMGITCWSLSISHTASLAIASAVATGEKQCQLQAP